MNPGKRGEKTCPSLEIRVCGFLHSLPYRHICILGCPDPGISRALLGKTQENCSACSAILATKQQPLLVLTLLISLARKVMKLKNNPDCPKAPRLSSTRGKYPPSPRGHVTMARGISGFHSWEVLLASREEGPGMLLSSLQCNSRASQQRMMQPVMSPVPRVRNPGLHKGNFPPWVDQGFRNPPFLKSISDK